ncbi:CBO0543 family protein [Paenibacillus sp. SAF-068]|uniref:CBO0543 family protein n=1 Tax=Paenibacillus sp. SAF-068 TaxID=3436864 RepID=UPI003F7FE22E
MIGNILLGMVIPIILGVWVLRRNLTILIQYYALGVAVSACINSVGFNYFWNILPNTRNQSYAALPMDLGIYPITGCLMMYAIIVKGANPWLAILVASLSLTFIEWVAKMMGHVIYFNGWNIFWTFLSYLLPFVIAYGYSKILRYTK